MDAKITNSNENKANPVNYSTQGFTGDPKVLCKSVGEYLIRKRNLWENISAEKDLFSHALVLSLIHI